MSGRDWTGRRAAIRAEVEAGARANGGRGSGSGGGTWAPSPQFAEALAAEVEARLHAEAARAGEVCTCAGDHVPAGLADPIRAPQRLDGAPVTSTRDASGQLRPVVREGGA